MPKCVICCLDININFNKVSTESTTGNENDQQTEFLLGSQNNRIAFQTFCNYFKISNQEWEKLCDNFNVGAGSKNSSNSQKYGKRQKLQDTSEINEEIPVPFCDECLELVKNLSDLDKMLKMIQTEVSKMFSDILTVILTRKNEKNNPHSSNSTPHKSDVDEIFGSEIIRLRNCIYEQYRPRLILSDYLKNKSPSQLTSEDVEHLTKSTNKTQDVKSHSPLHQNLKRKKRMTKTNSHKQNESSTTNQTNNNNNNFTTENPTSPNFMEIDEDPLNFNQEQEEVLENSQFNPKVINCYSANNNNSTAIKIEPSETTCTATSNDCKSPTKSRKAKNKAVLKIKHEIEEPHKNLNKNPNTFDSDGEYDNNDDDDDRNDDNGSEYESSCDENENEEEDDNGDWRASFGYSTAPKRKRGQPPKNKNKKNKPQHQNSDSDMDSQTDEIKRSKSRPPGAGNKKTTELKHLQQSTDNNDKNKIDLDERPSLVFLFKNHSCEQYEKEDGTTFFRCGSCGFTTSKRHSLFTHVDVTHSERNLQCIYCRGGKYSATLFARHMRKCHGDKKTKHVVIPCGPNLFYYNKHVFEKTESGFKCLHDECHQVFEERIQEIPTTTKLTAISVIDESDINLNPETSTSDCSSSQNPQDNNINNENNNSNQDPAQIQVQTATENETQQEEQVQESEQDKEQEEEMEQIKGTEFIIDHINLVHMRKCDVDPSQRQKIPSKKSCGLMCELCGRSFRTTYFLKLHVTIKHTEIRPWVCETCGLSFKIKDGLDKHQKIHNVEEEVFACTINGCGRTYKTKRYLRRHMSSDFHTEGKNYTCTICEKQGIIKQYHQPFGLKRHMRSHGIGREKTKKCPECFKAFYHPSEVRKHLTHCPVALGLQPLQEEEQEETNENENKTRRKK